MVPKVQNKIFNSLTLQKSPQKRNSSNIILKRRKSVHNSGIIIRIKNEQKSEEKFKSNPVNEDVDHTIESDDIFYSLKNPNESFHKNSFKKFLTYLPIHHKSPIKKLSRKYMTNRVMKISDLFMKRVHFLHQKSLS